MAQWQLTDPGVVEQWYVVDEGPAPVANPVNDPIYNPPDYSIPWSRLTGVPSTFPPAEHSHGWDEITGKPSVFPLADHSHGWVEITGKPSVFPPDIHAHTWAEIVGKPSTFPPETHSHGWAEITDKPSTFPPASHTHGFVELTGNPFSVSGGNVGLGTSSPTQLLHINASSDYAGVTVSRGEFTRAVLHQTSTGGKLDLYDSSLNQRVSLNADGVSKVHGGFGINLPVNQWPGFHLHISESSQAQTSVRVENNSGLSGAGADLRMYAWSGTNAPTGAFFVGGSSRGTKGNASPLTAGDRMAALIGVGQQTSGEDALNTGGMIEIAAASNWSATNHHSNVSIRINGPNQTAFPPAERLRIEGVGALAIPNAMQTPDAPAVSSEAKIYVRNNKLIVQYNDNRTVRYKYLDLSGTGVTWVHTTTAP